MGSKRKIFVEMNTFLRCIDNSVVEGHRAIAQNGDEIYRHVNFPNLMSFLKDEGYTPDEIYLRTWMSLADKPVGA